MDLPEHPDIIRRGWHGKEEWSKAYPVPPARWQVDDVPKPLYQRDLPNVSLIGRRTKTPNLSRVRQVGAGPICI